MCFWLALSAPYPAFFGGCRFLDEPSEEKNHCATGESGTEGGGWKPSLVGSRGETPESCDYFVFWIAQNIALVALRQRTVVKAYTRNQHFWEFGGLSLVSQTGIPASKYLWIRHLLWRYGIMVTSENYELFYTGIYWNGSLENFFETKAFCTSSKLTLVIKVWRESKPKR